MNRAGLLAVLLALLGLAGCGGGGGGGSTTGGTTGGAPGRLTYRTLWTSDTAQSQFIAILDANGAPLSTRALNREPGETTVQFDQVAAGIYEVRGTLYQLPNLGGARLGDFSIFLNLTGPVTLTSQTSGLTASVQVTPGQATIQAQESRRFAATALSGEGRVLFTASQFDWSENGDAFTVNTEGIVTGVQAGTAGVTARERSSGVQGQTTVTVTPFTPTRSKWTILVYLNAANDLFPYSTLNVNQMERVASNPDVRFIVQWKLTQEQWSQSLFDGTRRYLIQSDTTDQVRSRIVQEMGDSVDMGRPETLREFIAWGKQNYPADRYGLIIWNHGNGWRRGPEDWSSRAFSYDDDTGNSIQIWEIPQAFGSEQVDFVAWDTSLMQMIEVAYELRDNTPFVVGSEESPPGEGYPYDLIFREFRDRPDATTRQLTKAFVDGMLAVPEYNSRKITQSVLDSSRLVALAQAADGLAGALIANAGAVTNHVRWTRDNSQSYSPTASRFFRDLYDLTLKLDDSQTQFGALPADVLNANAAVRDAVSAAVVWEGNNSNSPGSHGVSVDFSPANRIGGSLFDYRRMRFAQDTRWDEWLQIAP